MTLLKRYRFHLVVAACLLALLAASVRTGVSQESRDAQALPRIDKQGQFDHAVELLPRGQRLKLLAPQQRTGDLRPYILDLVRNSLPQKDKHRAFEIARTVIVEANHHQMDPFFLLAVINTESNFRIKARGLHGEIGLMQLMPSTALWLAADAGVNEADLDLEDPQINIRIGATYFASLRKSFPGRGSRYVSAYNMGSANVRRLLASNVEPQTYSGKVIANYKTFYGGLSKRKAAGKQVAGRSVASAK